MPRLTPLAGVVMLMAACATTSARQTPPIWTIVTDPPPGVAMLARVRGPYVLVRFNKGAFDALMAGAGLDSDPGAKGVVLTLPFPDGTFERFLMKESPMIDPSLAKAFPEIKTYSGQGMDDRSATTRIGWTSAGFNGMTLAGERGTIYIDPYAPSTPDLYVVYRKGG